jgi:hypothetical protein
MIGSRRCGDHRSPVLQQRLDAIQNAARCGVARITAPGHELTLRERPVLAQSGRSYANSIPSLIRNK